MYPLSDVGCNSVTLDVDHDIIGRIIRHPELGSANACEVARTPRDGEFESSESSSDVR